MLNLSTSLNIDFSLLRAFGDGHDFHEMRPILNLPLIEETTHIDGSKQSYVYSPKLAASILANPPEQPITAMLFPGGEKAEYNVMLDYAEQGCFPALTAIFVYSVSKDWDIARLLEACPNIAYLGLPNEGDFGINRYASLKHLICNHDISTILASCSFPELRFLECGVLTKLEKGSLKQNLPNLRHFGAANEDGKDTVEFLEREELPEQFCSITFRQNLLESIEALQESKLASTISHLTLDEPTDMDVDMDPDHCTFAALDKKALPNLTYLKIDAAHRGLIRDHISALSNIIHEEIVLDISHCQIFDDDIDDLLAADILQQCKHVIMDGNHVLNEGKQSQLNALGSRITLGRQLEYLGDEDEYE